MRLVRWVTRPSASARVAAESASSAGRARIAAKAATARASFSFYNTRAEIDQLVEALHMAREILG